MGKKQKHAAALFKSGFNCAQSVFAAFCEGYGVSETAALKIASGLGSGVRRGEICGAVSGAVLVIGLKHGDSKADCNLKTEAFLEEFQKANHSIVCRDLLGCDISTPAGREKAVREKLFSTKCADLVVSAASILEKSGYTVITAHKETVERISD